MSLNHLTSLNDENKYFNIKCNTCSFGGNTELKTKSSNPFFVLTEGNTITTSSPLYYTCDWVSLRMRGTVIYDSSQAVSNPTNYFHCIFNIPPELVDRFSSGVIVLDSGYVVENGNPNTNTNSGNISRTLIIGNTVDCRVYYRQTQSTVINFKLVIDISLFKI